MKSPIQKMHNRNLKKSGFYFIDYWGKIIIMDVSDVNIKILKKNKFEF